MAEQDDIPRDYRGVKVVDSFDALAKEPFGAANAIVLKRSLSGDFNALARAVNGKEYGIGPIESIYDSPELVQKLPQEVEQVRADLEDMKKIFGQSALAYFVLSLRVSDSNDWQEKTSPHSFHADTSCSPDLGRFLCCYNTPTTEWIRNEDAIDLGKGAYAMREGATVYRFGIGDIWRMASRHRQYEETEPAGGYFAHRTPPAIKDRKPEDPPRMLMVAG